MPRVGSSNDGSSIKGRLQIVLFRRPKNVDIVRPTNVQIKRPRNVRIGRNSNVRMFFERPMGTFRGRPKGTLDTVRCMPLQIQRDRNLIRTYFLDVHKTSPVRPNAGWDASSETPLLIYLVLELDCTSQFLWWQICFKLITLKLRPLLVLAKCVN